MEFILWCSTNKPGRKAEIDQRVHQTLQRKIWGPSVTSNLTHLTLPVKMVMRLASRAWLLPPSRPLPRQLRPWPRSCPSAFGPWPSATVTHSRRSTCWRWPRPAEMGSKHVETKKAHEKCNVTLSARSIILTPDRFCTPAPCRGALVSSKAH